MLNKNQPIIEQIQEKGLKKVFHISEMVTGNDKEHISFANYLHKQILTIDVWNGEDQTHYGQVKVPLVRLLRQGQPQLIMS